MSRGPFAASLIAGAVAAFFADAAVAAPKPRPEVMKFKAGRVIFKRNRAGTQGSPEADLLVLPHETQFLLRSTFAARNRKGVVTTRTISLLISPASDPRTSGNVPAIYRAGEGLTAFYSVQTTTDADPVGTTKSWATDDRGAIPFVVRWKKFDPVTSRLTGTFSGQMSSGVVGVRGMRIVGGTFAVDMHFEDPPPPPVPGKR